MKIDFSAIKDGDTSSLVAIYKAYRRDFIKWSNSVYKLSEEDAKDIFQDAIIDFHRNIINGKIDELTCDARTYLFAIGKFKTINFLKKFNRSINLSYDQLINEYNTAEDMTQKKDKDEHFKETLRTHLSKLSDKERKIIELYYFEDKSMHEIAKELGYKNANVAKKMKFESFKKLAKLIKKNTLMLIF